MLASVSVYSAGSFRHTHQQLLKILVPFSVLKPQPSNREFPYHLWNTTDYNSIGKKQKK